MSKTTDFTVNRIAHEYYQRYVNNGVESASVWLAENLPKELVEDFKAVQHKVAKRYHLRHDG